MIRAIKSEAYKTARSAVFWILIVVLAAGFLPMTAVGVSRTLYTVLVFNYDEDAHHDAGQYAAAIQALIDFEMYARYDRAADSYMIESGAAALYEPGGALHEKHGWLIEQPYELMQTIDSELFPIDQQNVLEGWAFNRLMRDFSAIVFSGIIFAGYFFGRDFMSRGYAGQVIAGISRTHIVVGKFIVFALALLILSATQLAFAIIAYIPNVFKLGAGYVLRCIAVRLIIDLGLVSIASAFPFIFNDMIKSAAASLLFVMLFFSNRAVISVRLFDVYTNGTLWSYRFSSEAFLPALITTTGLFAASLALSVALFKRAQLK